MRSSLLRQEGGERRGFYCNDRILHECSFLQFYCQMKITNYQATQYAFKGIVYLKMEIQSLSIYPFANGK